jgi:hypothetical protein
MSSATFGIASLSLGTQIALLFALLSIICFVVSDRRSKDIKIVGEVIPLPSNLHGLGSYVLAWIFGIIAVALWVGGHLK